MEFFLRLADIGQESLVPLLSQVVTFFDTPLDTLVGLNAYGISTNVYPNWVNIVETFTPGNFVYKIYDWVSPPEGAAFSSTVAQSAVKIFSALGLDTSAPLWLFMLNNISYILILSICIRFVSIF